MGATDSRVQDEGRNLWKLCNSGSVKRVNDIVEHPEAIHLLEWRHPTNGLTPLMIASKRGFSEIVSTLIRAGADINSRDTGRHGNTPLHYAAYKNWSSVVRILLISGCNPYIWNHHGQTALDLARFREKRNVCMLLGNHSLIHKGWIFCKKETSVIPNWKRLWAVILRTTPTDDRYELALYSTQTDPKPKKIILLNPSEDKWSVREKLYWTDKKYMFAFDNPIRVLKMKQEEFTRSKVTSTPTRRGSSVSDMKASQKENPQLRFAAEDDITLLEWLSILDRSTYQKVPCQRDAPPNYDSISFQHSNLEFEDRQSSELFCSDCGADVQNNEQYCTQCGASIANISLDIAENLFPVENTIEKKSSLPEASAPPIEFEITEEYCESNQTINLNLNQSKTDHECIVCMDSTRNAVSVPCGHLSACYNCLTELQHSSGCPICRTKISSVVRVYNC